MRATVRQLREDGPTISVSILSANLLKLGEELAIIEQAGTNLVHIDVMDGVFCPRITVGPPLVGAIPDRFIKDCHLMIDEPIEKVRSFVDAGASIITCHVESTKHPHALLQSLAGAGVIRGIALNPGTGLNVVEPLIDDVELLLLLAVNPGWRGQSFLPATERRLVAARELIDGRDVLLELDGGITLENIESVRSLGADIVVSGSAIYDGGTPLENTRRMLAALRGGNR